ncbi:hypothetical protein [Cellulosimicrobium cellulans]|nr:hypothetical protein [Cellulosimicrobium cellulans]
MARDFAAERRAAGRVVPDDVARLAPDVATGPTAAADAPSPTSTGRSA